ncbi:MAG: type II toxin-antitoxin system HicA family toxin [Gammaproteobacteria bacterium]
MLKAGYARDRQRGSHIVLRQAVHPHRRIVVPDHAEVAKGTLRAILKQTGLTEWKNSKGFYETEWQTLQSHQLGLPTRPVRGRLIHKL